jgi:5-methylthioadenosine/S-adenosylhomocysteine deaminase
MSILIKNVHILTQDESRRRFFGDIYIEDDIISEISQQALSLEADCVIDGSKKLAIPGLINTHTHVPMTLFRGYGDDMVLSEWLEKRIWPVEAKLTKKAVEVATQLAFLEMISSGTTTCMDMYFFEDTIGSYASKMGMRAALGFAFIDHGTPEYSYEDLFPACHRFISHWKDHTLVTPVLAPHGVYTCGPETLDKIHDIATHHHLLIHTHCSETRDEVYSVERTYGCRPVAQLEKHGLLTDHMILAHCGWITKQEIADISAAGSSVSHCPVSNMKIATGGYAPVPEMLDAKIDVSLGTDGAASNNTLDMFETMKFCALLHKQHRWDPKILPAQQVFDMATVHASRCLHMQDRIGSLEEGKKADIALIDLQTPHLTPCYDPVSHIVYATKGSDVCTTIINGALVMHDRTFPSFHMQNILSEASEMAKVLTNTTI